ncbi:MULTISPECIES: hypothetical protein [unclassified Nostoc]|uniref:hypothetical protein n=1 Tax=unclassified Nostoc TaxID=2593658 RepID=UPI0025D11893|nr:MULTISPECIES: hypothetical protein [unclassified Nostoc]MBN3957809.1 hypothetical protein [Nostoc sp. NMS8]MEA5604482.1 hypothetical protein [Nostoc sp. UHCC 0252]
MQEQETLETYQQAIAIYETALKFTPNDFKTLRHLGMALEKLSQLHWCLDHHKYAIDTLKQAIATYKTAFEQTPNDDLNISYLGMLVERLAQQQFSQKQYTEAFVTYQQAVTIYDSVLKFAPNDYCSHALKAGVFNTIADSHSYLSQYRQALDNYQQASASYDISLLLKPIKPIEFDKARTLQKIGNCLQQLSSNQEALGYYQAAMEIFKRILPPNDKQINFVEQEMQKVLAELN